MAEPIEPATLSGLEGQVSALMTASQSGSPEEVLAELPGILAELAAAGAWELHHRARYAGLVALEVLERAEECRTAASAMAADVADQPTWVSAALSIRGMQAYRLGDHDDALRDLVLAQVAFEAAAEPSLALSYALTGLGIGFDTLGLYELALPAYEQAREIGPALGGQPEVAASAAYNLAELHLRWSLDLAAVHQREQAREHRRLAVRFAREGLEHAGGLSARWQMGGRLYLGCVEAIDGDPPQAVDVLEDVVEQARELRLPRDAAFAMPFLSRAHELCGDLAGAVAVARRAVSELPAGASGDMVRASKVQLADAELALARGSARAPGHAHPDHPAVVGEAAALAALAYADVLAADLWEQRVGRLRAAQAMLALERLRAEHAESTRASTEDPLTGVANLRGLRSALARLSGGDRRHRPAVPGDIAGSRPAPVSVVVVDVDAFKSVNDTFGHGAGDDVLREVAGLLSANARDGDLVARPGGDEFVVVLAGADSAVASAVAGRVIEASRTRSWPYRPITLSMGVATGLAPADPDELLSRADAAMYRVKRRGGDGAEIAT